MARLKVVGVALIAAICAAGLAVLAHANGNGEAPPRATLIQTKLIFSGAAPHGPVLRGSYLGEEPFCRNGTFRDFFVRDAIRKRFRCPGQGGLTLEFQPHGVGAEPRTQSGPWRFIRGTGEFADINTGRGWMAVRHRRASSREFFTGRMR